MSIWVSVDAIKRFAGEDYQKAVILPRDREYLLEVADPPRCPARRDPSRGTETVRPGPLACRS